MDIQGVVDQQHSVSSVGEVLEGWPGSILDGQDAKAVIEDIRIQGDDQEGVRADARGVESSLD